MKVFRITADSSTLIGLAQINQFELLKKLFLEIYIPGAVYYEVVIKGKNEVGSKETEKAINDGWIIKRNTADRLAVQAFSSTLGDGESEVIVLYKELALDYALIDEKMARGKAELIGVNVIGIIGVLNLAIEMGFDINKKELVDKLIGKGFRISDRLYKRMFPGSK
ncbi:MAG: DUF3368 domain-containing protein [Candidatus Aminicenantes bacterium]|nr:DUF3368 domain-containing protein [Candidatus Aminicenantes bacterium]